MIRVLDLFSGIGGISYGLEKTGGYETVCFCEKDPFARAVLGKHWPEVPIIEDILDGDFAKFIGGVDLVCGGWPCQTFSTAAHGNNTHPDMWPAFREVVKTVKPRWVVAENVPRATDIRGDLSDLGYRSSRWRFRLPFRGHIRDRVYFVAHSDRHCKSMRPFNDEASRLLQNEASSWEASPRAVGVYDGVPRRMDRRRLRTLGNSVVTVFPELIGKAILKVETGLDD